jgi:hypothetical protein
MPLSIAIAAPPDNISTMTSSSPTTKPAAPSAGGFVNRVASMDAYRGLVMLLMMAEVLELSRVAKALPENGLWQFLAYH